MGDARITTAPLETLLQESGGGDVRITASQLEALRGEEPVVWARVTAGPIEILISGQQGEPPEPEEPPVFVGTIYSSVDLPDPSSYYLGFKDGRVLSFGTATRTLSDLTGQWSANDISVTLADTDRAVRTVLEQAKGLRETPCIVRLVSDADRRALLTPTVVFRGALRSWKPRGNLAVDLEYTDAVGLKLARRGNDRRLPTRLVTATDFPSAPSTSQAKPVPIIYGTHTWWTGACPVVYAGQMDLGAGGLNTWIVAGHAVKAIPKLYVDDVEQAGWGDAWYAPGQAGWVYATPYVDINGRRYTLIQGDGEDADACAAGNATLTVNVQGIESMGDGSGLLLSQSYLQYLHFFQNFVLADYQGGAWLETPAEWEPGWCQINAQTFVDAQAESTRWVSGSGYVGQAYIGPEARSVRDWLAVWNTSLNCRLGLNRYHQWILATLPGALTAEEIDALPALSDEQDVLQGSFDIEGLEDEAITRATVSAYQLPKDSGVYGGSERYVDRAAEADSGTEIGAELLLDFLSSTPQTVGPLPTYLMESAEDVAKRWIGIRSGPPLYRATFQAGLCAYEAVDVGDLFRLTHFAGTTADGWTDRILWCESVALDIDQRVATFTALDVTHVYTGSRTLENIVDPQPPKPEDPPVVPPIEGERPIAPTGFGGGLVDATLGSNYYGTAGTTVYYKLVAVFDNGEESKPAIIGPFTTDGDGGSNVRKRVHMTWNAYPTGSQTGIAGGTVTPVAMRIYRSGDNGFLGTVQQMDREKYPAPEEPGNLRCWQKSGSGTTYYYRVYQYYYLSGRSDSTHNISVESGATPDVWLDWWEDAAVDQVNIGTPSKDFSDGVMVQQIFGRSDDGGGGPGRYLDCGLFGGYHDDGDDIEKGGGGIYPFPNPPTGHDIPMTGTSFYDMWPGKQDVAENPWVTL